MEAKTKITEQGERTGGLVVIWNIGREEEKKKKETESLKAYIGGGKRRTHRIIEYEVISQKLFFG